MKIMQKLLATAAVLRGLSKESNNFSQISAIKATTLPGRRQMSPPRRSDLFFTSTLVATSMKKYVGSYMRKDSPNALKSLKIT